MNTDEGIDQYYYYLQDSRSFTGNCVMWWKKSGGYTSNLKEAEIYNWEEACKRHGARNTDLPRKVSDVNKITQVTVDMQYLKSIALTLPLSHP